MVEEVTPEDVKSKIDSGEGIQVIDIRDPAGFNAGHIPGAINIPFAEFPKRVQDHEWGDDIVVACPIGQSSIQAARLLESYEGVEEGSRVASMAGGYEEWEYELETDDDSAITVDD